MLKYLAHRLPLTLETATPWCRMNPQPSPELSALCQGILNYLQAHPQAADNLVGIAAWWVPSPGPAGSTDAVQAALTLLVEQRRIARIDLPDGQALYQRLGKVLLPPPLPRS